MTGHSRSYALRHHNVQPTSNVVHDQSTTSKFQNTILQSIHHTPENLSPGHTIETGIPNFENSVASRIKRLSWQPKRLLQRSKAGCEALFPIVLCGCCGILGSCQLLCRCRAHLGCDVHSNLIQHLHGTHHISLSITLKMRQDAAWKALRYESRGAQLP